MSSALLARGKLVLAGLLVLAAAAGGVWYRFFYHPDTPVDGGPGPAVVLQPDPPPPDPRLTFPTAFRNVKPGVKYVGDAACAGCHAAIDHTYHKHPMGRSAAFTKQAGPLEKYDAAARNPFTVGPYTLRVEKTADGVRHVVSAKDGAGNPLPDYVLTPDVAIGSGTRGRSYVAVEHGAAWQSPLSWFAGTAGWDVSPGFELASGGRRAIQPGCLFCHVDRVEPVPHTLNRFTEPLLKGQANVGCERCHGPGELHVAEREKAGVTGRDDTIVNPKHLTADLRSDICRQCHLQGETVVPRRGRDATEYRPGLPWDQFMSVFERHPDVAEANRSVGQFEQMAQSKCFTGGKLDCTSCHDPHVKPEGADAVKFFRSRCLTCHEQKGCTAPPPERQAKADSCVACHMPRGDSTSIIHAAVTNHRVPRRPDSPLPSPRGMIPGALPIVPYPPGPHAPPQDERDRDYGIALARLAAKAQGGGRSLQELLGSAAEERLAKALVRWPGDAAAWDALALARSAHFDPPAMLEAARNAVALAPDDEVAQTRLVAAATADGKPEEALRAADRLVALSPRSVDHLLDRAAVRMQLKDWKQAEGDCRAALAIHPLHVQARLTLAMCLHKQGDADAGGREAKTAAGLATSPRMAAAIAETYRQFTK